jgi:competence protein ComEC
MPASNDAWTRWFLSACGVVVAVLAAIGALLVGMPAGSGPAVPLPAVSPAPPGPPLSVRFLDVGQGDATLITSPAGRTLLIDGGRSQADMERLILPALRATGNRAVDMLVVTHPDQDHIGGLPYLLESAPVGQVVLTGQVHTTRTYERLLTLLRDRRIPAIKARAGVRLDLDPDLDLAVLGPDDAAVAGDDTNNASVVIRLTYRDFVVVFTGDAEETEEETILRSGADVRAHVLKVAHHGSRSASGERWLQAVAPRVAIISAAAGNPYQHPHPQVLRRLQDTGATIYRTDHHGTVTVRSNGRTFQVFTER